MMEISKEFPEDEKGKDKVDLSEDKNYFKLEYKSYSELLNKTFQFEQTTGLEIRKHFFKITDQYTIDSILKQIEEHKWYLSEKSGTEVEMSFAANEWVEKIYNPIIKEFNKLKIFEYFQNTNSLKLYTDIMAHKYYLSLENGEDVGI